MKVSVFVPSHITGFFIIANNKDLLKKGSCGVGVLLDKGVLTKIKHSKKEDKIDIKINGVKDSKNEIISKKTIELIKKDFDLNNGMKINHEIEVPIGSGFGTSAACALGVTTTISTLLNLPISNIQSYQYAHKAEVELGSGLGDVISETSKGIVIRKKPGASGIGKVESINLPKDQLDLYVISKTLGKINTKNIIQDPLQKKRINKIGTTIHEKFMSNPTLEKFLNCSYEFAKKTNLMNEDVSELVNELKEFTLGSSMAMLGNTAFGLSKEPYCDIEGAIISKIDNHGMKFINQK